VQDLLLVALKAIEEFDPLRDCSLKTWVNLKMDYHIQEVKRKVATSPVRIEYVGDLHDLFLFVQRYRFYGTVFHCGEVAFIYDRLTQKQRDILDLKLQGYTYAEIAEKLGYSDHSGVIRQWGKIAALLNEEKSNKPVTN
jgi:AraC-like DNA-binding protein